MFALLLALGKFLPIVLPAIQGYVQKKAELATEQEKTRREAQLAEVNAEVARKNALRDILVAEQGWWVTAWIRPLFAYPIVVHFALIVADSIWQFDWNIAALPEPMATWEGWIVGAYFLMRPVEKIGTAIARRK